MHRGRQRALAAVSLVTGSLVILASGMSAFGVLRVGGGPDGWCMRGSVRPPLGFGAPDYEQITATGQPSLFPLGIVCRFVASDGSVAVATTPWWTTAFAAVGVALIVVAATVCLRSLGTMRTRPRQG
ncbi:hypothetical protein BH10ACT7_BH10ACT7_22590 [soil metagenome]